MKDNLIDWEKAYNSPHLSREKLYFEVQMGNTQFANLVMFEEIQEYSAYFEERGYTIDLLVNKNLPVLKGRYVMNFRRKEFKRSLSFEEILEVSGSEGQEIELMFDRWIKFGKKPMEEEVNYYFNELRKTTSNPEVYSHFVEIYNSILEKDSQGLLKE